jgi:hypothetical protein
MSRDLKDCAIYVAYDDNEPIDLAAPEKRLLQAILETAIDDLLKRGRHAERARDYFLSREQDYVFSFRSVCDYLQIDAQAILRHAGINID